MSLLTTTKWCQGEAVFQAASVTIMDVPLGSAELDFATLASCDGLIMSIGTFGWWAGWISHFRNHVPVIYFDGEFNMKHAINANKIDVQQYYPSTWSRVSAEKRVVTAAAVATTTVRAAAAVNSATPWPSNLKKSKDDAGIITRYADNAVNYFEFVGDGGVHVPDPLGGGMQKVVMVIGHFLQVHDILRQHSLREPIKTGFAKIIYVDLGDPNVEDDPKVKTNFDRYTNAIREETAEFYDTIIINDRFPISCALCVVDHISPSAVVLIPNYESKARETDLSVLDKFYNIVEKSWQAYVLQRKRDVDQQELDSTKRSNRFK